MFTHICKFCYETVLSANKRWDSHHRSREVFDASIKEGCVLCATLSHDIDLELGEERHSLQWPLYRWSISQNAYVRESTPVLSLIFRALKPVACLDKNVILPDRGFDIYRDQDHHITASTTLGPSTNCVESWNQVHKWLQLCTENHPNCERALLKVSDLPTRLLDVGDIDFQTKSGYLRLVETKAWQIPAPYVTLSHSWGPNPTFYTITADKKEFMKNEGIPWNHRELSRNFQDAILAARRLQIRYIWIDSMCIIQDDPDDFDREAPLMHRYYSNSYCNLGASASRLPHQGLFRNREEASSSALVTHARFNPKDGGSIFKGSEWILVPREVWEAQLLSSPLYERAWVFQERMLAPRVLHFAEREIFFECSTMSACESFPHGVPRRNNRKAAYDRRGRYRLHMSIDPKKPDVYGEADLSLDAFWSTAIRTYTSCKLTKDSDKLIALSGLTRLVRDALGEPNGKGLWAERLEEQLAWRVVGCRRADGRPSCKADNAEPTWSWASIDGVISLSSRSVPERDYRVLSHDGAKIAFRVNDKEGKPAPPSSFRVRAEDGRVDGPNVAMHDDAVIQIRGCLTQGFVKQRHDTRKWVFQLAHTSEKEELVPVRNLEVFPDFASIDQATNHFAMVLAYSRDEPVDSDVLVYGFAGTVNMHERVTFSGIGLILHERSDNYYERLGCFIITGMSEEDLSSMVHVSSHDKDRAGDGGTNGNGPRENELRHQNIYLI